MKVLNFGSLNLDHVYTMDHFVEPKETQKALEYMVNFGGKGLNQSIALVKAGMKVYHAGKIGADGKALAEYLEKYGVDVSYLDIDPKAPTGHAIIQVAGAQNSIIIYGGANVMIDPPLIDKVLEHFEKGDILLIQNEISSLDYLIRAAHEKGMKIVFNIAPFDEKATKLPLDLVDTLVVNEVEGKGLSGQSSSRYEDIIKGIRKNYPEAEIVLTVGADGSYYIKGDEMIYQHAYRVKPVDTTAAGDTFIGFYLALLAQGHEIRECLRIASLASSIAVLKPGAAQSIPTMEEVLASKAARKSVNKE